VGEEITHEPAVAGVSMTPAAPAARPDHPEHGIPWLPWLGSRDAWERALGVRTVNILLVCLRFLLSPSVWGLCLMYGFVGFAGNFITSLLPIYLRDHRALSDRTTAILSGLPLAFGIVSCLLGGVLSDLIIRWTGSRKWGRRLVGGTSLALAAVACLGALWSRDEWSIALSFSAWFFFSDGSMGPAWASCADVGERYAGTLSGAMNMTGAFLGAIGMALAGRLLHRHLDEVMFIVFACSYALAALCWLLVDVTKPLVPKQDG
jgi:nitrate/nitrite transporter NarK